MLWGLLAFLLPDGPPARRREGRHRSHRRIERAQDARTHLRRESPVQHHGAVVLVPEGEAAVLVLGVGPLGLLRPLRPAIQAHELLHVLRGAVQPDVEEVGFVLRGSDARNGPNLGVAELTFGKRFRQERQPDQRPGDADLLPSGVGIVASRCSLTPSRSSRGSTSTGSISSSMNWRWTNAPVNSSGDRSRPRPSGPRPRFAVSPARDGAGVVGNADERDRQRRTSLGRDPRIHSHRHEPEDTRQSPSTRAALAVASGRGSPGRRRCSSIPEIVMRTSCFRCRLRYRQVLIHLPYRSFIKVAARRVARRGIRHR